jgi:hypothetical protein
MDGKPFTPLPPVAVLVTPNLSQKVAADLLDAVNKVRSGEEVIEVAVTYHKVTKAKPRIAGQHYQPLPGVEPIFHEGTLVAAPTNKKGNVYLLVSDAARAPIPTDDEEETATGWTALSLAGLKSFRVRPNGHRPGPVALARQATKTQALADIAAAIAKIKT